MNQKYKPKKIEKKWQKFWVNGKIFEPNFKKSKKPFYNLMMFPYPSAEGLHVGNMYAFTGADIYGRFKKMQGYDLFEPIGLDGFGIHSENFALKTNKHPADLAKITQKNFYKQLHSTGNAYAWQERLETYNPRYYGWTQWLFLQLYKAGLAYQKEAPVNFCPQCKTVISDEQIIQGRCERCDAQVETKFLKQWFFKITHYADRLLKNLDIIDWSEKVKIAQRNWIGKSEGAQIDFEVKLLKTKFVLIHGYKGGAEKNFFPWLKNELKKRGYEVFCPNLPNPFQPKISEQINYILNNFEIDENTVLVGHSLGCAVILKLLENFKRKVKKVVLVAPSLRFKFKDKKSRPFLKKAFGWQLDLAKIKDKTDNFVILADLKDHIIFIEDTREIANHLGAKNVEVVARKAHFCSKQEPHILKETLEFLKVFTTRIDTIFGATYLVISPLHELIRKNLLPLTQEAKNYIEKITKKPKKEPEKEKTGVFSGLYAINPATNQKVPIWISDYVLAGYGTGAIMGVPAHDLRDFEFAKKYNLPVKRVIVPINECRSYVIKRGLEEKNLEAFKNELREYKFNFQINQEGNFLVQFEKEKIEKFVEILKKYLKNSFWAEILGQKNFFYFAPEGLINFENESDISKIWQKCLARGEGIRHLKSVWEMLWSVTFYREVICYQGGGILINSAKFNGLKSEEASEVILKWLEERGLAKKSVSYHLRDWLISRQRYWGPPIPIIYCANCGTVPVPEKNLPVRLPYIKDFKPLGTGKSPLANHPEFYETTCPRCRGTARRETDVSDTFLDSSWYYLGYLLLSQNAKNRRQDYKSSLKRLQSLIRRWLPVDMYIGGAEHSVLHLMYARFIAMALKDLKTIHFGEPFKKFRAHGLLISQGAKISKSRGNIINPDEYIKKYGADTFRMYLMFLGPFDQGGDFRDEGIIGIYRFLNRVWSLIIKFKKQNRKARIKVNNKEIDRLRHETIKKITEDVENLRYNTAISQLMVYQNHLTEIGIQRLKIEDLKTLLLLLAPFAPHISEELWQHLKNHGSKTKKVKSIFQEKWPKYNPRMIKVETFKLVIQIDGKTRDIIEAKIGVSENEAKNLALRSPKIKKWLQGKEIIKTFYIQNRILSLLTKEK